MATIGKKSILFIALILIVAFLESSVPYWFAEQYKPDGYTFSGQVSYSPDQNMYFSFISQARDGAFVLKNKLTFLSHSPVFVNLEYWLVGAIQRVFGLSENSVYHVWRFIGLLLLLIGFNMVSRMAFPESRHRRQAAMVLFLFSGGFGFVFAVLDQLHLIDFDTAHNGIIDMRYGIMPFQQIITNPHFSLPHGLILIAYAFFMMGVRAGTTKYYIYSGLVFNIIGLVRPYDIIPPCVIFPLFVLVTQKGAPIDVRQILRKMLPLFMIVPVFLYNLWLFKYHDIFKHWSLQGHNAGSFPSMFWHYMAFGIIGVLAWLKMFRSRWEHLGATGRFLVLWFGVTFVFIHLGKYISALGWSPQIGVYLAAPLTIAACSLDFSRLFPKVAVRRIAMVVIVGFVLVSNLSLVMYHSRKFFLRVNTESFYVSNDDMAAMKWLKVNTEPGAVVLADVTTSQHIAKYTSNAVVAAHYSVTPDFAQYSAEVNKLLTNKDVVSGNVPIPQKLHASYLYLHEPTDNPIEKGEYLEPIYSNKSVAIYQTAQ